MRHFTVRSLLHGGLALGIVAGLLTLVRPVPQAAASLQTRLEAYWQARVQNNMPLALQYEHPRQRKQLGEKISRARQRSGITITGFSVRDRRALQPDPEAREARVEMRVHYAYTFPSAPGRTRPVSTVIADAWRKEQGVWYHVLQTEVIPDTP